MSPLVTAHKEWAMHFIVMLGELGMNELANVNANTWHTSHSHFTVMPLNVVSLLLAYSCCGGVG
jgi:hypothetical protein